MLFDNERGKAMLFDEKEWDAKHCPTITDRFIKDAAERLYTSDVVNAYRTGTDDHDMPGDQIIDEHFMGEFDTFEEFIYAYSEETDMMPPVAPGWHAPEPDLIAWEQDFWYRDTDRGTVYVFAHS